MHEKQGAVWPAPTQHLRKKRGKQAIKVSTKRRSGKRQESASGKKNTHWWIIRIPPQCGGIVKKQDFHLCCSGRGMRNMAAWRNRNHVRKLKEGGLLELFLTSSFLSMWKWWTFKLKIVMICKEISLEKKKLPNYYCYCNYSHYSY